jgi:hypothetical protein
MLTVERNDGEAAISKKTSCSYEQTRENAKGQNRLLTASSVSRR